jgi:hypothetical protein
VRIEGRRRFRLAGAGSALPPADGGDLLEDLCPVFARFLSRAPRKGVARHEVGPGLMAGARGLFGALAGNRAACAADRLVESFDVDDGVNRVRVKCLMR